MHHPDSANGASFGSDCATILTAVQLVLLQPTSVKASKLQVTEGYKHITYDLSQPWMFHSPTADSEQRAIAEALSDVDALLGALEALIAKKRAIKQAAMQQLLTGKTRLPGFSGEWETKRVGRSLRSSEAEGHSSTRRIRRTTVRVEG